MLPTQFIPEYYRDGKDILNAGDAGEHKREDSRPRRSLFAFVLRLLRRSKSRRKDSSVASQERLAHR